MSQPDLKELFEWMSKPYPQPALILKNKPVCVTGASGYIAGHVVEQLINKGYTVHGTIRNKDKPAPHLADLDHVGGRLILFSADLNQQGSFDEATKGCDCVIHTASPFLLKVKDPQKDIVDPAVKGTLTVLESCLKNGVKKVVLTSSCAAVADQGVPGKVFTEADFNTTSSLNRNAYYYSKIQAELAAWKFVRENPSIQLVVINPFSVIGPSHLGTVGESSEMIHQILTGKLPGIINLGFGHVDVRDVAAAHILAMEKPDACGRYICSKQYIDVKYMCEFVRKEFPEYNPPTFDMSGTIGTWLVYLQSWTMPKGQRDAVQCNAGRPVHVDNTRIQTHLGLQMRPIDDSIRDTINDFIAHGLIPTPKKTGKAVSTGTAQTS